MDKQHSLLIANFINGRLEVIASEVLSHSDLSGRDDLVPLVREWLNNQVAFLRDEPFRAGEWTAQMVAQLGSAGADVEEAHRFLQCCRNALISSCQGKIEGVSDLDLCQRLMGISDTHTQHLVSHFSQFMRELEIAEHRARKAIVETLNRPLALLDAQGLVEMANREFSRCLKTTPDALTGQDIMGLCDGPTGQQLRAALRQKPAAQQPKSFAGALKWDSQSVQGQFFVRPLFNAAGLRTGATVCLDIEQVAVSDPQAGIAYAQAHLLSGIPLPIQMFDREGRITYSSDAMATLHVDDYDGKQPLCCFLSGQGHGEGHSCACTQVFESGLFHTEELSYYDHGRTQWVFLLLVPIPDDSGGIAQVACCVYDMTRRKQIQKQLEYQIIAQQRSSLVAQIAVTVAHQLRNPLSVVIGFAEMLSKGVPPEQTYEAVSRILRNGLRCKDIVENLLSFGKGMPQDRRHVDITKLINQSVQPLLTPAQRRKVEWRFPETPAPVECVPEQLAQVVSSVLDNALRACRERVVCTIESKPDAVRLRVCDDGPGIPADVRDRIFDPFFTTRRAEGAVGLGLSLARAVAVDYAGSLKVSAPTGDEPTGVCMVLQLPKVHRVSPAAADDSFRVPMASAEAMERRVLIVDDEADLLDLLKTTLFTQGFFVEAVSSGMDALQKLKTGRFDVVVLDFQLSGALDGRDIYEYIAENNTDLVDRTLFITADTMNYQTRQFLLSTGRPVLEKPFLLDDFTKELEKLLG